MDESVTSAILICAGQLIPAEEFLAYQEGL